MGTVIKMWLKKSSRKLTMTKNQLLSLWWMNSFSRVGLAIYQCC